MARVKKKRRNYNARKLAIRRIRRLLSLSKSTRKYKKKKLRGRKKRGRKKKRIYKTRRTFKFASKPFLIRHQSVSQPGKFTDRLAVVVKVKGQNVAFYKSTGTGTPGLVSKGEWVAFNGISRRHGGWFIKTPGKIPTGDLKTTAAWLHTHMKRKKPAKIFDDGKYTTQEESNAAVNEFIDRHGALYRQGGGPFQIGTVNVGKR